MPTTLGSLIENIKTPVEISQEAYNGLPSEAKNDGTTYYILDGSPSYQIAANTPAQASDGTASNVQAELNKKLEESKIVNGGSATEPGYVLDARYGKELTDRLNSFVATLIVNCGTITSLPTNPIESPKITGDMIVIGADIGDSTIDTSDWIVTTSRGSLFIDGTLELGASTTLTLYLSHATEA